MDSALTALYADYGDALMREAATALPDRASVLDLLQDTMIRAWLHCATFRAESQLLPWLKSIFRHRLVDLLRKRHPEQPLAASGDGIDAEVEAALQAERGGADATPDALLRSKQAEDCYRACAARFAREHPVEALVIRWIADDGLGVPELAALLNKTPGAAREYLSQCRKKARVYFADWRALTQRGTRGEESP